MKQIEAIKLINEMDRNHQKKIFTSRELSLLSGESRPAVGMALLRLGYNLMSPPDLENLALAYHPLSYVSFETALYRQNLLSQAPQGLLSVATTGRPRREQTALGEIEFIHVKEDLFFGFDENRLAYPEKALLDLVYIRKKRGRSALPDVTFYLEDLNQKRLREFASAFPVSVQRAVQAELKSFRG